MAARRLPAANTPRRPCPASPFPREDAREYEPSQRSPVFRTNGATQPASADYARHQAEGFARWRLAVDGLVARPLALSLADLRARSARTQITRHDCVEGWSAIGEWTGAPLGPLLDEAGLQPDARFVVLRCADASGGGAPITRASTCWTRSTLRPSLPTA